MNELKTSIVLINIFVSREFFPVGISTTYFLLVRRITDLNGVIFYLDKVSFSDTEISPRQTITIKHTAIDVVVVVVVVVVIVVVV